MLTWTHNNNYDIMWYILCWLGITTSSFIMLTRIHNIVYDSITTSSVLYIDLASQHWYRCHVIYFKLTRTHNITSIYFMLSLTHNIEMWFTLCWLGLTTSSIFHVDSDSQRWLWFYVIHFMLTWTINIISISCWLGLTTLIVISCSMFYVDSDSQH